MFLRPSPATWPVVAAAQKANRIKPNGVPDNLAWKHNGRIVMGINPTAGLTYLTPWGVCQRATGAVLGDDLLIAVRDMQCWVRLAGGWVKHDDRYRVAALAYPENFDTVTTPAIAAPSYSASPDHRITSLLDGRAYHFYTSTPRKQVNPADILAVATVYEAKLLSKTGADISGEVGKIVATAGCDWWNQAEAGGTNNSCFVSGYQTVQASWRKIFGTTLRLKDAAQYGVPDAFQQLGQIDAAGVDPAYVPN